MAEKSELLAIISRARRDMPRNTLVMSLCDALEGFLLKTDKKPLTRAEIQRNYRQRKKAKAAGVS
jgi:hypothetical protein